MEFYHLIAVSIFKTQVRQFSFCQNNTSSFLKFWLISSMGIVKFLYAQEKTYWGPSEWGYSTIKICILLALWNYMNNMHK